ncbi:MAG: Crp/Fnr family transcriptional regulator [Bacteroidota bacterium]
MMGKNQEHYITTYLREFDPLTAEEMASLRPTLAVKEYPRRAYFFRRGEVQKGLGFLLEGLVRRYYINDKGNEITTGFNKEREYVTDYPSFIKQRPTQCFVQCLEPSIILTIPYPTIQECYQKSDTFQRYGRLMAERALTILNDRVENFLFNTPEERYVKFRTERPDLMERVSLTHLASFLGVERQSLSRIRKRLSQQ